MNQVIQGDCLEVMPTLADKSVDLILTDPPYGLKFMGKDWDHGVPGVHFWEQALRVAKPGTHLMAFGGTRTFHRLAVAIEDAGWEIRDTLMWVYGSGFPKSLDVSKAIDKAAGSEREVVGQGSSGKTAIWSKGDMGDFSITAPATPEAKEWEGWGTALKPAWEPIILARKPLIGTVAENVLRYGTGGINVDGCRVEMVDREAYEEKLRSFKGATGKAGKASWKNSSPLNDPETSIENSKLGRWPANLIHDGSDGVVGLFPYQKSGKVKPYVINRDRGVVDFNRGLTQKTGYFPSSEGSAARFFYCAKASRKERGEGNTHPTVKPLALMKYLITLGLPPGGVVLDPFAGSGTTAVACLELGRRFICIEKSADYHQMILDRIEDWKSRDNS